MGFRSRKYIVAICDSCNVEFENSDGGTECFEKESHARDIVKSCDWIVKNGKLLCPQCCEEA